VPRIEAIKNAFVGGEISPYVLGRTDMEKYHVACEKISNFVVRQQGGVIRRPGLLYKADAMGPSRLIPFNLSLTQSFILEFGNQKIRFFTNEGQVYSSTFPWPPFITGITVDGTVTWTNRGKPQFIGNHVYTIGNFLLDTNGNIQQVIAVTGDAASGVNHPTWNMVIGGTTTQSHVFGPFGMAGSVTWINLGKPVRMPSTSYNLNALILDTNGNIEQVTQAGITGGLIPYEIPSPYNTTVDDLWDIKFAQIASTMYLVHPNHPPMKLIRVADNNWKLIQPVFYAAPATKQDQNVSGGSISISISGNTITASANVFIAGDVGKAVIAGSGRGYISALAGGTSVDSGTGATLRSQVTITITDPFDAVLYTAGNWFLRGGPLAYFAAGVFLTDGSQEWNGTRKFGFGKQIPIRSTTGYPTDRTWQTSTGSALQNVKYTAGFTDAFRTIDVGLYVPFAGGYGQIIAVADSTHATVTVLAIPIVLDQSAYGIGIISPTPPGGWAVETPEFSNGNFPRSVTMFGDRLYFASTQNNAQTFWGSNVGDYENFALGTLDADGIRFTLNSGQLEPILWMEVFQGNIVAGTYLAEYLINGGAGQAVQSAGAPLTPNNINTIRQSRYGTSRVQPLLVDTDLLYIQRSRQRLYEFSFNAITSAYGSRNLTILNDIITTSSFREMVLQKQPNSVVWFTDEDGNLIGLTYEKSQDVWAWHRHFTGVDIGDQVISVGGIPTVDPITQVQEDEIWAVCRRIRNGAVVYTIEYLDQTGVLNLDCASRTVFGGSVTQVGNLQYLQGRNISVVADGVVLPSIVMDGTGVYKFPGGFSAFDVQVGLNYISELLTVRPEPKLTLQGLIKRWIKVWVRLYNSLGLVINGQQVAFRTTAVPLDENVPLFTGDVQVNNLGYDRDGRINIQQTQPLPCNVLSIFGNLEISDGI